MLILDVLTGLEENHDQTGNDILKIKYIPGIKHLDTCRNDQNLKEIHNKSRHIIVFFFSWPRSAFQELFSAPLHSKRRPSPRNESISGIGNGDLQLIYSAEGKSDEEMRLTCRLFSVDRRMIGPETRYSFTDFHLFQHPQ